MLREDAQGLDGSLLEGGFRSRAHAVDGKGRGPSAHDENGKDDARDDARLYGESA